MYICVQSTKVFGRVPDQNFAELNLDSGLRTSLFPCFPFLNLHIWGWRDGPEAQSIYYSCRGSSVPSTYIRLLTVTVTPATGTRGPTLTSMGIIVM